MNLKEWRTSRQKTFTLDGGLELVVRPVSVSRLAAQGEIPAPLLVVAQAAIQGKDTPPTWGAEELRATNDLVDRVVKAAVISPPLADQSDEAHLGLDEIPDEVRYAIFNWCSAGAAKLEPFRQEPAPNGDGSSGGEQVLGAPVEPAGN